MSNTSFTKLCWICNSPAETREHVHKKTDLKQILNDDNGFERLVKISGEHKTKKIELADAKFERIQGVNSIELKYPYNLCKECNSTTTQPYDFSYGKFIDYILKNKESIVKNSNFDFSEIYGEKFELSTSNLFRYFAKSIGCRINDAGEKVPSDIKKLAGGRSFTNTKLKISFAINLDMIKLPERYQTGLGKAALIAPKYNWPYTRYLWRESNRWLNIFYWYGYLPDKDFGETLITNSKLITLGKYKPMMPKNSFWAEFGSWDKQYIQTFMSEA